eukprot:jgi/Undpi1/1050/HiC_scaffold_10.g04513.m1
MSSESEDSEFRHWHGRRCRHRYRQSEDEGSDASSPREELVTDASPSHEETDTPRQGDWIPAARGAGALWSGLRGPRRDFDLHWSSLSSSPSRPSRSSSGCSWKPAEVVPQHKRRAILLYSGLILAIFGYSGYLVYHAVGAYGNPSTSFALSNNVYKYPDIYVCLYNFYGCDNQELEEDCVRSAQITEGGNSTAVFNQNGDDEQDLHVDAFLTDEKGWCVEFAASEIIISEGERDPEDYILLNMFWYPGGSANASTTCIDEEGGWESHSENVFIHFRDVDTGVLSAGIQVAYSCMTKSSNSHLFNYVGIGLTKEHNLRSGDTASYSAIATSSALYKDKRDDSSPGIVNPYVWLSMEVAQVTNSLEEITEIDPLEIAEIFGNIGGFWGESRETEEQNLPAETWALSRSRSRPCSRPRDSRRGKLPEEGSEDKTSDEPQDNIPDSPFKRDDSPVREEKEADQLPVDSEASRRQLSPAPRERYQLSSPRSTERHPQSPRDRGARVGPSDLAFEAKWAQRALEDTKQTTLRRVARQRLNDEDIKRAKHAEREASVVAERTHQALAQ